MTDHTAEMKKINDTSSGTGFMPEPIKEARWKRPLCPYLMTGNHRILMHLDAFLIPQSFQWPSPGAPERIGKRNLCDEWPYWREMPQAEIALQMPGFEYEDAHIETLDSATDVAVGYLPDSNVLRGFYRLPGGMELAETLLVHSDSDCWVRHYHIRGNGRWFFRGEFFDQMVPGHAQSHLGDAGYRGFLSARPSGVFVLHSDRPLSRNGREYSLAVNGEIEVTLYFSVGKDLAEAVAISEAQRKNGFDQMLAETLEKDRTALRRAGTPVSQHPFIVKNYKRWLLSNSLLIGENGFSISGVRPFWGFAWPRDCSQQALGFAAAGFLEEAEKIMSHLLAIAPSSGVYEARYQYDAVPMLLDNRPPQGDHAGFICKVCAMIAEMDPDDSWINSVAPQLFQLADHLVKRRNPESGLPLPAADHRETVVAESLSNAIASAAGLLGAASVAEKLMQYELADKYRTAAQSIRDAVEKLLWDPVERYFHTSIVPDNPKADISLCWGALPFRLWRPEDEKLRAGVLKIYTDRWDSDHGGVISSPGTPYASYWMYYASILLLGLDGIGEYEKANEVVSSLAVNASPQGLIPEQTSLADGELIGCAPLPPPQGNLLFHAFFKP
ncbi:MAG: hypothetical protein E7054_05635 [Lentisphaerae bacterium]|nr:hypothetical protein [Lentisphaerota bacterium]